VLHIIIRNRIGLALQFKDRERQREGERKKERISNPTNEPNIMDNNTKIDMSNVINSMYNSLYECIQC